MPLKGKILSSSIRGLNGALGVSPHQQPATTTGPGLLVGPNTYSTHVSLFPGGVFIGR